MLTAPPLAQGWTGKLAALNAGLARAAETAPGVGLGLALSRRLARDMGGDFELQPTYSRLEADPEMLRTFELAADRVKPTPEQVAEAVRRPLASTTPASARCLRRRCDGRRSSPSP